MRFPALPALLGALAVFPAAAQVQITPGPDKISVQIDGKPYTDFYVAGADVTKPYLHPLRAASGTYVTRMWPMENVEEEAKDQKDHPHQRGVWFAHDSVNGLDFWNNEASYTTPNRGRIALKELGAVKGGADSGSIAATFEWTPMSGGAALLREDRVMTFYRDPKLRTIDFDITLTALQRVTFGDGKDGVFGIRIRPILQEDTGTGRIVNADGLATEKEVWGKPSNWCDYSGDVHGEKLGIAVLDNPANPRHPVRWHVRGYGLFAANVFGLNVFTNDKSQNGAVTIEPGQTLRYRYRVVVHPGDAKTADVAGLWVKYAGK
ncbi:MAG TPA: PmoA family protein [Bryobacteraceae bacterium]|nr:PmoA family protein [Bryobacteraceae bacterium]